MDKITKWSGKIAVVTGASSGMGAEIMKDFANKGIKVIGLARRQNKIEEIATELGQIPGEIHAHRCDVTDLKSIQETFNWIEKKFGKLHILVNNAGIGSNKPILQSELKEEEKNYDDVIQTNFNGLVHMCRHAFPLMSKTDEHGMIINIGSIASYTVPYTPEGTISNVYHGTKFAVRATSEILRQELINMKNNKIRISLVSPGVCETNFFKAAEYVPQDFVMGTVLPALKPSDISNAVNYVLETPYEVNVTEMIVKPVGEKL